MTYLSSIVMDPGRWDVIHDLKNRDRLHKKIMAAFPDSEFSDPRRRMGILFRVEKDRIILQSRVAPDSSKIVGGYRLATSKDVSDAYSKIRAGIPYRFRIDANTSWRVDQDPDDLEWIPHSTVQVKKAQRRVGCGTYPERARWFERRMNSIGAQPGVYFMDSLPLIEIAKGVLEATRFEGHLEVLDVGKFRKAVEEGIGQGKPYGLGLLSIA